MPASWRHGRRDLAARTNRKLRDVLRMKGYETIYREFNGLTRIRAGAGLADALRACWPTDRRNAQDYMATGELPEPVSWACCCRNEAGPYR